jgi:large subunit ribosomal protein L4
MRRADGTRAGTVGLSDEIFGIAPNLAVMHQVVVAQLAAARAGTHKTKTRSEVRGGGAKPWRQKGTGRARQGSNRAPQWAGGGTVFGPAPRSYEQRTPKKMRRLALRSALSRRAAEGRVVVTEIELDEPKTRVARDALLAMGCAARTLVVLTDDEEALGLSLRNLPHCQTTVAGELSTYDVVRNDWIVFTPASLEGVQGSLLVDRSSAEEQLQVEEEQGSGEEDSGERARPRRARRARQAREPESAEAIEAEQPEPDSDDEAEQAEPDSDDEAER